MNCHIKKWGKHVDVILAWGFLHLETRLMGCTEMLTYQTNYCECLEICHLFAWYICYQINLAT